MVYGARGRDGKSILIQDRHVCRPKVVRGGLHVVVVRVFMCVVWRNHFSDAIDEGRINQVLCTLKGNKSCIRRTQKKANLINSLIKSTPISSKISRFFII